MAEHEETRLADPPMEWLAGHEFIRVWGVQDEESGYWQALLPDFSIGTQADTFDEAAKEAVEMLLDHLRVCFREGRSFEESRQPVPASMKARLLLTEGLKTARAKMRRRHDVFRHEHVHLAV